MTQYLAAWLQWSVRVSNMFACLYIREPNVVSVLKWCLYRAICQASEWWAVKFTWILETFDMQQNKGSIMKNDLA